MFTICGSPCPLVVVTNRGRLCCGNQMKKRETQRWFQSDKHQRYWWLLQLYCMKVRMATLGLYGQGSSQSDRRWTGALPLMKFGKASLRACVAFKWMIGNCWGNCPAIRVCSFLILFNLPISLCFYCCGTGWQNLAAFRREQKWQWKFSSSAYLQFSRQMHRFCA